MPARFVCPYRSMRPTTPEIKGIARDKRVSAAWVVRAAVTSYLNARTPLFTSDSSGTER